MSFVKSRFASIHNEGLRSLVWRMSKGLVNQVGYHYRFVAAFQEMKRLVDLGRSQGHPQYPS